MPLCSVTATRGSAIHIRNWLAATNDPGPVNIGNPDEMSVLQIAEDVVAATESGSEIKLVDLPVDDPKVRRPDTTRAQQLLGWQPVVPWEQGLARTVDWFRTVELEAS